MLLVILLSTLALTNIENGFLCLQVARTAAQMPLKDVVCNGSLLEKMLSVEGGATNMTDLQTQLCNLPAEVLKEAESLFFSQFDLTKFITVSTDLIDVEFLKKIKSKI